MVGGQELVGRSQVCAWNIKVSVTVTQPWPLWSPSTGFPACLSFTTARRTCVRQGTPQGL